MWMISFAGIDLPDASGADAAWVRQHIDPSWVCEAAERSWPGPGLAHLGFGRRMPRGPLTLGSLCWPCWGASVFATAHFLCDAAALDAVRQTAGDGPADLVMDDGQGSITAAMYPLPARPLQDGPGGLWLLSLTDVRYRWWMVPATATVAPGTTTWAGLFGSLADALGVTIDVDPVPAVYLKPPADLGAQARALPPLLDAAALSVGMRLVASLDGSFRLMSAASSQVALAANLALPGLTREAGGLFSLAQG